MAEESPPVDAARMTGATRVLLVIAMASVVVVAWLVWRYDPADARTHFPLCPFHWLTGLNCPGCGATRALHALLHGDVRRALLFNPLFVVALPVVAAFVGHALLGFFGVVPRRRPLPARTVYALVGLLLVYGVVRNIIGI